MSRLLIVQTLVAIGSRKVNFAKTEIIYLEAEDYSPSESDVRKEIAASRTDPSRMALFLSSGIFEITVVPELSSFAPATEQTLLVSFPSLDAHHLTALRTEIQPTRFSFIQCTPSNASENWRLQMTSELNSISEIENSQVHSASALDYRDTLSLLLELYSESLHRERMIIAPTGSKMQTVAVGIFRAFVADVQIVYPTPSAFRNPETYTKGVSSLYRLNLSPFSAYKSE